MVLGAIAYASVVSCLIPIVGRRLAGAAEARNESEARLRAELIRLRENADSIALSAGHSHARARIAGTYRRLVVDWLALVRQHGHVTWVMNSNTALVPVVPLLIAAPKYLQGALSLGEVMQLASAFIQVQLAIGWLVDNYWRLAEWQASARRVFELADALEGDGEPGGIGFGPGPDGLVRVDGLRLTDPHGRVLVDQAAFVVAPGERILIGGEPGVGKSVLGRALAGLWLWGSGTVAMPLGARLAFLPPWPFLPQGTLSAAVLYPDDPSETTDEEAVERALVRCGLVHLVPRLAEVARWDRVLSAGECYRLGLVRLVLQRPSVVVMDGFVGAIDPAMQDLLADILAIELASATVIMVGPVGRLSPIATRTLVLLAGRNGARLVETTEQTGAVLAPVAGVRTRARRARALQP
jgi:putative ATP-binding cassette transporter